ncbi:hypothetical protein Aduo_015502 [Ancylostoma duodenale]
MASIEYGRDFDHISSLLDPATPTQTIEREIGKEICNISPQIKMAKTLHTGWSHHIIQHTCSEAGTGEQVLLINRFLRTGSVAREKLICYTQHYLLLDSFLRQKDSPKSYYINIKAKIIQNTVEKELKRLDSNIADIECELDQAALKVTDERTGLIKVKHMLKDLEKRLLQSSQEDTTNEEKLARLSISQYPEETVEPMGEGEDQNDEKQDQPITDEDYLAQLVAENLLEDKKTGEPEPGARTPEEIIPIAEVRDRSPSPNTKVEYEEREETPSLDIDDNIKRRRVDSSCEQKDNTRRLQQDLRDFAIRPSLPATTKDRKDICRSGAQYQMYLLQ